MATYAIGDVQGCYDELRALLGRVGFDRAHDRLWFVGDLVNRGPKSLEVLRFVKELGDRAIVVLGNHDLHLITQHEGFERKREDDTFGDVLAAPDATDLVAWLRTRPMMYVEGNYALVHAGLLPQWTIQSALSLGKEVETALRAPNYRDFFANMYGSKPERWDDALAGWDRGIAGWCSCPAPAINRSENEKCTGNETDKEKKMSDCVFCKIVTGQMPSTRVFEDEHSLAFMDIGQVTPGHVLVAVKKHADNLYALDGAQAAAVARASVRVARAIRDAFKPEGLSVYQANGKAAGQTVFHYHVHLLPRHAGDGMELTWPVKNPPRETLEDYAGKIRAGLAKPVG